MSSKKIATSIKIYPEVLKEAKIYAIEQGLNLSELIELSLKKEMRKK